MAEINDLPPPYRIQPGMPVSATGKDKQQPVQPLKDDQQDKQKRRKRKPDDDGNQLDEYA